MPRYFHAPLTSNRVDIPLQALKMYFNGEIVVVGRS
jgi:hypothetical protein